MLLNIMFKDDLEELEKSEKEPMFTMASKYCAFDVMSLEAR